MARPGTTSPDLVSELRAMKTRLEALERKPIPQTSYDQYPCVEWAATPRGPVADNKWSSVSVANVTGLRYDRVESKFLAYDVRAGRSEAEVRLAAFRHSYNSSLKECISATSTVRLTGNTNGVVAVCKWRWIHGIEFGWDYTDSDDAIYTIELQHRNPNDCPRTEDPGTDVFAWNKPSNKSGDPDLSVWSPIHIANDSGNDYRFIGERRPRGGSMNAPAGWVRVSDGWDGRYNLSQMHYCVGVPQDRAPNAAVPGWFWIVGGGVEFARGPNINEPVFSV